MVDSGISSGPIYPASAVSRRDLMGAVALSSLVASAPDGVAASAPGSPRLFFTPAALANAQSLKASGQLNPAWANLKAAADAAVTAGVSPFKNTTDPTRAWQRHVGWSMANLAAAFLLGANTAHRDMAIQLATSAAAYPVWGKDTFDGGDLQAADLLFGISMVVDWLGAVMSPSALATLIAVLRTRGAKMAAYATGNGEPVAYWAKWWLMNHLWDDMTGLLTTGLVLQPYAPSDAAAFIAVAKPRLDYAFSVLPPDGATQESPTYWEFTAESVLKFHHLATHVLGETLHGNWLVHAASYRGAAALPLADSTPTQSVVNQADSATYPWFGPEYQLRRLAALNRDGVAQALAAQLEARNLVFPASPWLNFIWYDPTVPAATTSPPLLQYFSDLDIVASRSDWSGHESMLFMRSGAPFGRQAQRRHYPYNVGMSHVHQDVNHITLFAAGQFLLVDDGYSGRKLTAQHNTLLVNSYGQSYEGKSYTAASQWPIPDPQPHLLVVQASPAVDYWLGEGVSAYPSAAGLTRFDRHVLFVKPDILVVIDDLSAAATADFSLLWHTGAATAPTTAPLQYAATFKATSLLATFVLPDGGQTALGSRTFILEKGRTTVPEIAVTLSGAAVQTGAVFAWGTHSGTGQVSLRRSSRTWIVTTASQRFNLLPIKRLLW